MGVKIGKKASLKDMGTIGQRDAFHVPAVFVEAMDNMLSPGGPASFTDDSFTKVECRAEHKNHHAACDPFVKDIRKGDMFWVFLGPKFVDQFTHSFDITIPGLKKHLPVGKEAYDSEDEDEAEYGDDGCGRCYDS